ncbi:MAG TPA: STAS domain-containing protein [Chthoniobacterales bacterium]
MDIQKDHAGGALVLRLSGRLDASWADAVERALADAVRGGDHHLILDLAGVDYVSSAGLRVLIGGCSQARAIRGSFAVRNMQPAVAKVVELSGLGVLFIEKAPPETATAAAQEREFRAHGASWTAYGTAVPVRLRAIGGLSPFDAAQGEVVKFPSPVAGLGIGALASNREQAVGRFGEFLAAGGCAAHLPPGGVRPDFLVAEHELVPAAWMASGLVAEGDPGLLLRFEAENRSISLAAIASEVLEQTDGRPVLTILVAETLGLVGASLRRSPDTGGEGSLAFPAVRDWLSFTSERSYRDTTSVVIALIAHPGSAWDTRLRPLDRSGNLLGHAHAAVFPYRPLRKGLVPLGDTVKEIFASGGGPQTVLHLLNDTREPDGSGDSEFTRGACWIAPITDHCAP